MAFPPFPHSPRVADSGPSAPLATDPLLRGNLRLGDFDVTLCTDGPFLLDGGAMFGVVPKTLWSKRMPADAENRIVLGTNTVVLRDGRHTVLIETGVGNKQTAKMREILANRELLPRSLAAAGVRPEDVTHVLNTHLHFDHCGWNTTVRANGQVTPTFPNARYFAALGEVQHGHRQLDRDRVSYVSANFDPLIANGQMTLLDLGGKAGEVMLDGPEAPLRARVQAGAEIVPGVSVECFPGHTASMLGVHVRSGGEHACYIGDLIPTSAHLDPTWCTGYDLDPLRVIEERRRFYTRAIPERWWVLFPHDHDTPAARLTVNDRGRPVIAADSRQRA